MIDNYPGTVVMLPVFIFDRTYSTVDNQYRQPTHLAGNNVLVEFGLLLCLERWMTRRHFIQQDTKSPPVHWETVALRHIQYTHCDSKKRIPVSLEISATNLATTLFAWKAAYTSTTIIAAAGAYTRRFIMCTWTEKHSNIYTLTQSNQKLSIV